MKVANYAKNTDAVVDTILINDDIVKRNHNTTFKHFIINFFEYRM